MKKTGKFMAFTLLIAIMISLVACGAKEEGTKNESAPAACNHQVTVDAAVAATCTESGLSEGKHCTLCNEVIVKQEEIPAVGHTEEVIPAIEANCTTAGASEGKKCSACGEILVAIEEIASLGHTTTTGTCTRCNTCFGIFSVGYYVDEFNQPTKDGYVVNDDYIIGTFSNSATTDSLLNVKILADSEDIVFFLYEYGRNMVKNSSSRYVDEYQITMKTADGTKHNLTGTLYCGGDRIFVDDRYTATVFKALKSGEIVSFYIVEKEYATTNYLFTVNSSNFAEEYAKAFG